MITGGDLRQSRLDVGYKTFTISPWDGAQTADTPMLANSNRDPSTNVINATNKPR